MSEFDCEKLKRNNMKNNMKNIINKAFSKSCFRYMCIKTEILIYILYLLKSNIDNIDSVENIKPFLGGIHYAMNKSKNMNMKRNSNSNSNSNSNMKRNSNSNSNSNSNKFEKVNSMGRYIWEMSTVFNLFLIPDKFNCKYIPSHHVFGYDRHLEFENIFGMCWDVINAENLDREIIYHYPVGQLIDKPERGILMKNNTPDIDDESTSQLITSYTENYILIIDTIQVLLRNKNISIPQLTTLLSNLLKPELPYEVQSSEKILFIF